MSASKVLELMYNLIKKKLLKNPLWKTLDYAKEHIPSLKNVLLDSILEVNTNTAKQEIEPFVIGRENLANIDLAYSECLENLTP